MSVHIGQQKCKTTAMRAAVVLVALAHINTRFGSCHLESMTTLRGHTECRPSHPWLTLCRQQARTMYTRRRRRRRPRPPPCHWQDTCARLSRAVRRCCLMRRRIHRFAHCIDYAITLAAIAHLRSVRHIWSAHVCSICGGAPCEGFLGGSQSSQTSSTSISRTTSFTMCRRWRLQTSLDLLYSAFPTTLCIHFFRTK